MARAAIDPKEVSKVKDILHHAYTYYKQAADEVKAHGQFVFQGTERYGAYVSEFHQNLRKQSSKPTSEPEADEPTIEAAP